jgi:sugar transferase EpsL
VNGRNGIGWNKRLEMDVWYVDHQSIWLDVRILFKTSVQVLRRVGVNASSSVTMPELRPAKERYPG